MSASDTVERLVKRNVIIAITGLIYAIPTIVVLMTELNKPNRNYFSIIMTIGLVSIPQGWLQVKELAGVKISVGINKIEDIAIYLILLVFKVILVLAVSALLSPLIFVTNLIEFIANCTKISRAKSSGNYRNGTAEQGGSQRKNPSALPFVLLAAILIIGGIFAFNALKRSRKVTEPAKESVAVTKPQTAPAAVTTPENTVATPKPQAEDDRISPKTPTPAETRAETADPKTDKTVAAPDKTVAATDTTDAAPDKTEAAPDKTPKYTPGICVKSWRGWHSKNWSPKFFERGGHKYVSLVRNEKIGIFDPSNFDENGRAFGLVTMAYKGYFHARASGIYTFMIKHPSVPARWPCGSYALYIDGKKLIGMINRRYDPRKNGEKKVRIRLYEGYHDFMLINEVNWQCPAASHIEIEYVTPTRATKALSNANAFLLSEKDAQDR